VEFQLTEHSRFDPDLMFRTHRDDLQALVPYMTLVDRVRAEGRENRADGTCILTHRWVCTKEAVPTLIRPMIPPNMLVWIGRATWNPNTRSCAWEVEIPGLGPAVTVTGVHRYLADEPGTRVELVGDFAIHAEKIPNLPPRISGPMVGAIERFIAQVIVTVMKATHRAVIAYLDDQAS
jgi:hypothetical protein